MIDRATKERRAGHHDEALELAQRAAQIQWTPSLRLFVMQEQVTTGALADAYGSALRCQSEAARDRAASAQTVAQLCDEAARSLRARVGRVIVRTEPAREGVRVFVGPRELPPLLLRHEYVVTPGTMVVRAQGPSIEPVEREITVVPGASVEVELVLRERPSPAARETPAAPPALAETPPTAPRAAQPRAAQPARATRPAVTALPAGPIAVIAVGGASLVTGAIAAIVAVQAIGEYDQRCPPAAQHCAPDEAVAGRAAYDRADTSIAVSASTAAIGALAIGAGALWFTRSSTRRERAPIAWIAPVSGGATLGVTGVF